MIPAGDIDRAVATLQDIVKIGATAYPPLEFAVPLLNAFIAHEGHKLKIGIATGAIVSDGKGGFVPASNSRYNPITGEFL
jgi:hypothetical protein